VLERDAGRILGRTDVDETRELPPRYRAGTTSIENYLASRTGPRGYMLRLRRIEDETARHERELGRAWRKLAVACEGRPSAFAERWRRIAGRRSFRRVNALIEQHNRWYPAEARLPMSPRTGDFIAVDGRTYRREPLDAAWALRRFPANLDEAKVL
jgi:hypothetical protein